MSQGPHWFSPDGRWQWDGEHWVPVSGLPAPEPDPEPEPERQPAREAWYRTVPGLRTESRRNAALAATGIAALLVLVAVIVWRPSSGSDPAAGRSTITSPGRSAAGAAPGPASPVPTLAAGLPPLAPPPSEAPVPVGAVTVSPTPCPSNVHGAHARRLCAPSASPSPSQSPQGSGQQGG